MIKEMIILAIEPRNPYEKIKLHILSQFNESLHLFINEIELLFY